MNLAQAIDPEWVLLGARERVARRERAEVPLGVECMVARPPAPPVKRGPNGMAERLLVALADQRRPLLVRGVVAQVGDATTVQVSGALRALVARGEVLRSGRSQQYRYVLTARGRTRASELRA